MRLLELRGNEATGDPHTAAPPPEAGRKPALEARALKRPAAGRTSPADARVFPINSPSTDKSPRRRPIDLEQLQRRIEALERRIQERTRTQAAATSAPADKELEQLRQRMKLLERRIEGELWSARQREHTLLEILAKPPLHIRLKQQLVRFLHTAPVAVMDFMHTGGKAWWQHAQPMWWPRFAAAWQEALNRARN